MNMHPSTLLRNEISRLSILALIGLSVFAVLVLAANPFSVHPDSKAATASSPTTSQEVSSSSRIISESLPSAPAQGHSDEHDDVQSQGDP